jgi:hypothetical protein
MPDGNGTGRTPGFVAGLSNVRLIDGVKVGGTTESVLSATATVDKDVPASPFSSSKTLTAGNSSLAVKLLGLLSFEADVPTFCGEMANPWDGE